MELVILIIIHYVYYLPIEGYMYFVSLTSHDFLNTNQILMKMDTISEEVVEFVMEMSLLVVEMEIV